MRAAVGILALAVTACASAQPAGPLPDGIVGSDWVARTVAGRPVPEDIAVTLQFPQAGQIAGRSGCNRYSGPIRVADGRLVIGPLATTRMACPPPQSEFETLFLATLDQAERLARDNRALLLHAAGQEPSRFEPFTPP